MTFYDFRRSLSLFITREGTVHSAAAVNSMMREEHRHLLWAFGCINNIVKGYFLLFLYSLDEL